MTVSFRTYVEVGDGAVAFLWSLGGGAFFSSFFGVAICKFFALEEISPQHLQWNANVPETIQSRVSIRLYWSIETFRNDCHSCSLTSCHVPHYRWSDVGQAPSSGNLAHFFFILEPTRYIFIYIMVQINECTFIISSFSVMNNAPSRSTMWCDRFLYFVFPVSSETD